MNHLLRYVVICVVVVLGSSILASHSVTTVAAGEWQADDDSSLVRGGRLILLLTATGWDQERFTVPPGTYEYQDDNGSGGAYTVKGRRIRPDGERKVVISELISVGGRVEGEVRLRAGDKFVVRIMERKEWKAIVNVVAN